MCRECPTQRIKVEGTEMECSCSCSASMVKNGKCERCGHFLDFYKRPKKYRPTWGHRSDL